MVKSDKIKPVALVEYTENANSLLFDTPVIGLEIYVSDNGGKSWTKTHDDYIDAVYSSYGYYFGNIRKANTKTPYVYSSKEGKQTNFHFFRMLQVIEPGDQLPLRIVRDRIINSIKNQTINTMIQQTEARLIQAARKSNKIKIFDEE